MTEEPRPNLYTIPAGAPFLPTLVNSLLSGQLVKDFTYQADKPHQLARVRIFVPTRRAVRALRSEFVDQIGLGSVILPDIRPLGEAEDDLGFFDDSAQAQFPLAEPISRTQSKLILGELILAWKQALPKAFSDQFKSVPIVAPASPADAIWMAEDLLSLIESAESEEIDLSLLDQISPDDHANWWQLTLEFLKILRQYWPARLKEINRQSIIKYQISMLEKQTSYIDENWHDGPIIVAGSTGSLPATARLINVVSKKNNGAVILPGLDQNMSPSEWVTIFSVAHDKPLEQTKDHLASIVLQGHPQFGLARLFTRLGLNEKDIYDVPALSDLEGALSYRQKLISKAMLPATMTDSWAASSREDSDDQTLATDEITLIEAKNDHEEVLSIAAAIRIAIEPDKDKRDPNIALVTPDRNLARRVSIALKQYGLDANDSGGQSLDQTPIGSLITLSLDWICKDGDNAMLTAILKHPFAQFGYDRADKDKAVSTIERLVLRRVNKPVKFMELAQHTRVQFDKLAEEKYLSNWLKDITEEDIQLALELTHRLVSAFKLFAADHGVEQLQPISNWVEKTIYLLEQITKSSTDEFDLWDNEAGSLITQIFEDIRQSDASFKVSAQEWTDMIAPLLSSQTVKPQSGMHPNVMIWGTLETRLQNVDTIILAGLNEGTWPGSGGNDPFLSRTMKSQIGLEPPERRIGLAAHDFQMALGMKKVILSRALKSNGAPSVASRWLQRLLTILNDTSVETMRKRGQNLIAYSQLNPAKKHRGTIERPDPKPDACHQPKSYSFSEVGTLRRDPYAIYARRILGLSALEDFSSEPDLRDRGTIYHAVLEDFSKSIDKDLNETHVNLLMDILDRHFDEHQLPLPIALLWKHRFLKIIPFYVNWEAERTKDIQQRYIELSSRCQLPATFEVYLTGRADRIDLRDDGTADIIDFKTGTNPSAKEARSLLDPQLPLEAYALSKGGFKGLAAYTTNSLKYVRLKPSDRLIVDNVEDKPSKANPDPLSPVQLGENAIKQLCNFIEALHSNEKGFTSRLIPKLERDYSGEYDHLARVSEWSVLEKSLGERIDD